MAVYIARRGGTGVSQLECIPFAPSDGCTGPGMPRFCLTVPLPVLLHPARPSGPGLVAAVRALVWKWDVWGAWRALWRPSCAQVDLWQLQ